MNKLHLLENHIYLFFVNLKIEFLAVINIPKEPVKDVNMRIFQIKPKYLKGFKACKYLNSLEEDFKARNLEYNKERSN